MKLLRRIFTEEFPFALSTPAVIWQVFFLFLPLSLLLAYSVIGYSSETQRYFVTLFFYRKVLSSIYFGVIINSFCMALATASICFAIAYPLAYFFAMKIQKKYRPFLIFSLILPSWTSFIVQVYAWFFLLDHNSFLMQFLYNIGLISSSMRFLNNHFAILIGMVSVYLPFMVLPLYTVLEKIDKRVLEASADLGAPRYETFRRVVFPLSLSGVYAGMLLVFLPAFGEFAIPTLLGGNKTAFWGNVIVDKFLISQEWQSGAALAIVGVSVPLLLILTGYLASSVIEMIRVYRRSRSTTSKDVW